MKNNNGGKYGYTGLFPIRDWSHAATLRSHLRTMSRHPLGSPLSAVPIIHVARLVVIDDLPFQALPAKIDLLNSAYLLFVCDFDGADPFALVNALANAAAGVMQQVWAHCLGYPGPGASVVELTEYFRRCQLTTNLLLADQPEATVIDILKALQLKRALVDFVQKHQTTDPANTPSRVSGYGRGLQCRARPGAGQPVGFFGPVTAMTDAPDVHRFVKHHVFPDVQGNVLRGYTRLTSARFLFFAIDHAVDGRAFLSALAPHISPGEWSKPSSEVTEAVNLAVSFEGLRAFGLSAECLASFPSPFQDGMKRRAADLGDVGESAPENWDQPWRGSSVHLLLMAYAVDTAHLSAICDRVLALAPQGVRELRPAQEAGLLVIDGEPSRREHFGFMDGLSNPSIEGVPDRERRHGSPGRDVGIPDQNGRYRPARLGEFLLGHCDEGGEITDLPVPHILARNGTYLVWRKLHQHVARFRQYVRDEAARLGQRVPVAKPEWVAAKMMGRWPNGTPLALHPDEPGVDGGVSLENQFGYADDPVGAHCPLGAHVRRAFPRDSLGFGGRLVSRRRLIRRGIAYGSYLSPGAPEDDQPRGIVFLGFNASIERQFEFIQQQWINYGDEFHQGNDTDPITGSRPSDAGGRMVVPGDERIGRRSLCCGPLPQFVTTKGGEYFFVPSMTGLRLLATGEVCTT